MTTQGDEDKKAWLEEIESVEPLDPLLRKPKSSHHPLHRYTADQDSDRPTAQQRSTPHTLTRISSAAALSIASNNGSVLFNRGGPNRRTIQRLKRGDIELEGSLDLHGHTQIEAGTALETFLVESLAASCRCVQIIHGKGRHSSGEAVLKTFVAKRLMEIQEVLAFCSAQPRDGGIGALYVLLRR